MKHGRKLRFSVQEAGQKFESESRDFLPGVCAYTDEKIMEKKLIKILTGQSYEKIY